MPKHDDVLRDRGDSDDRDLYLSPEDLAGLHRVDGRDAQPLQLSGESGEDIAQPLRDVEGELEALDAIQAEPTRLGAPDGLEEPLAQHVDDGLGGRLPD